MRGILTGSNVLYALGIVSGFLHRVGQWCRLSSPTISLRSRIWRRCPIVRLVVYLLGVGLSSFELPIVLFAFAEAVYVNQGRYPLSLYSLCREEKRLNHSISIVGSPKNGLVFARIYVHIVECTLARMYAIVKYRCDVHNACSCIRITCKL